MNREKWLWLKLGLFILMFVILLGISSVVINYSKSNSTRFGFTIMKNIPSVEGEQKLFSNVEKIVIDSISLPVYIYESDVAEVAVTDNSKIYGLGIGKPNTLSQDSDILYFKQEKRVSFLSFATGNIVVEVPRGSVLEYDIRNVSGSVTHDAMSRDTLSAISVSGAVKVHQGGETVFAKSTSGSVRIYSPFEDVSAKSVSGSVRILANQDSRQISASSISGSVRIQLENVSGYEMDYSTTSGSVKDTYANIGYSKSGKASHGDSSLKIKASSVSGSIKFTDWE